MTSRPSTAAPILTVLAVVLVTLGAYVGGYFWLGDAFTFESWNGPTYIEREFPHQWQQIAFQPVGWLEQLLRGTTVELTWHGADNWHSSSRYLEANR